MNDNRRDRKTDWLNVEHTLPLAGPSLTSKLQVTEVKQASLLVMQGRSLGRSYLLGNSELTIGRSTEADISIVDNGASRLHASINHSGDMQYIIRDLDSTNGTFINSKKITEVELQRGDLIKVGENTVFKFVIGGDIEKKYQERMYGDLKNALEEVQATKEQLIQAQKLSALGQLVAGVAHEIKNPLNFIQANFWQIDKTVERLRDNIFGLLPDDADGAEVKKIFAKDFENLKSMHEQQKSGTSRVIDISKSLTSFGRADQTFCPKNPNDIIDEALLILRHRLSGVQIKKEFEDLPPIDCLPAPLGQVFINLINNALDATFTIRDPQQTVLNIQSSVEEDKARFSIKDNGPGIPEEIKKRLFEAFVTSKESGKGTGMGLSICLTIVEEHSGTIDVNSSDQGTEFVISLPIKQEKASPSPS